SDIEVVGIDAGRGRGAADFNVGRLRFEVAESDAGERHAYGSAGPRTFGGYLERQAGGLAKRVAEGDCGRAQIARDVEFDRLNSAVGRGAEAERAGNRELRRDGFREHRDRFELRQ